MASEVATAEMLRAARRSYELGRLRVSTVRASLVAMVVALLAGYFAGPSAMPWAALTLLAWVLLGWRGGALLRGGRYGLAAGAITFLLPMSVLRPCCRPGVTMNMGECCTMPGLCLLVGGALGLLLASFVPRGKGARRWETAAGMAIGMTSVAVLKCSGLFMGEAFGLLGGLCGGVALVSGVGALLEIKRAQRA